MTAAGPAGTVYWITGLAGAGKTTLARALYERLRGSHRSVVLLDGDGLRSVFGGGFGHTLADRRQLAGTYSRLCQLLSEQNLDVVIGTISMFHDVRAWNREHLRAYREIYLDVPFAVLAARDQKGLYSRSGTDADGTVIGVDVVPELPLNPDVVLTNDGRRSPEALVTECCERLGL